MRGSCIYIIRNFIDDRIYIGSTNRMVHRYGNHKRDLKRGTHGNAHLQNFVNKYGFGAIYFDILEHCEVEDLITREQHYLDTMKPQFNICLKAESALGVKRHKPMTEEHKRNISQTLKGRLRDEDSKRRQSEAQMGRVWSEASRKKASESHKGRKKSPEAIAKMAETKRGVKQSPETITKRMAGRVMTPEYRAKLSAAAKRQWERVKQNKTITT